MTRVSLKSIKKELETFKTLDEKKQYLETIISKTKTEKLKKSLQKLLDEVSKHLEHETKFTKEIPLEEKLSSQEIPAEVLSRAPFSEIKYVPRPTESVLETNVRTAPLPQFTRISPTEVKYEPRIGYSSFHESIDELRFYLSREAKLVQTFTPNTWTNLAEPLKQEVADKISAAFGTTEYDRLKSYINTVFGIEQPGEHYKKVKSS